MRSLKRFVLLWCAVLLMMVAFGIHRQQAAAQSSGSGFVAPGPGAAPDPCSYAPKNVVPISVTSATTVELIAGHTGREISVCQVNVSIGTSSTLQWAQGAVGATTGLQVMSGAETAVLPQPGNSTLMRAQAGNSVFIITTGTGGQKGWATYVYENQQPQIVPTPTPYAAATPT